MNQNIKIFLFLLLSAFVTIMIIALIMNYAYGMFVPSNIKSVLKSGISPSSIAGLIGIDASVLSSLTSLDASVLDKLKDLKNIDLNILNNIPTIQNSLAAINASPLMALTPIQVTNLMTMLS